MIYFVVCIALKTIERTENLHSVAEIICTRVLLHSCNVKSNDRKKNTSTVSSEIERIKRLLIYKRSELWHKHNV